MVKKVTYLLLWIVCSLSIGGVAAQESGFRMLEALSRGVTPKVRKNVVMISRLGVADVRVGILLSEVGHILVPRITPIDSTPSPYLFYQPDGTRIQLETVSEHEKRGLALLKLPDSIPEGMKPALLTSAEEDPGFWFIVPTTPVLPLVNEPVIIRLESLKPVEEDEEEEEVLGIQVFDIEAEALRKGQLVLDVSGRLAGVVSKGREDSSSVVPIREVLRDWRALADCTARSETELPILVDQEVAHLLLPLIPLQTPYGLVANVDHSPTNSAQGIVIDANGLVITKASELGASLTFRINGETHPAALVATDETTDLALLVVDAKNLPVVKFSEVELQAGQFLFAPRLLTQNSEDIEDVVDAELLVAGSYSHERDFSMPNIHASAMVTSVGMVPEQSEDRLVIAAILPESPAAEAELKIKDELLSINDTKLSNRAELARYLADRKAGEEVQVKIRRDDSEIEVSLTLMAKFPKPRLTGVDVSKNYVAMVPSVRRSPFPKCIVHDLVLNAWECGGPLYDTEGRVVGMNIAATGQYCSLALPPKVILQAIERMKKNVSAF